MAGLFIKYFKRSQSGIAHGGFVEAGIAEALSTDLVEDTPACLDEDPFENLD